MDGSNDVDAIVVGAGISGLTTALCLQDAGLRVCVLEGAARIGGRVHAVTGADDNEVLGDLGPTWVWPRWQPVVARWIDRLSLVPFDQYEEGHGILDGFGGPPRRQLLPGQDGIARLVGGPSAIVAALSAQLHPERVITGAEVIEVQDTATGLRVVTADDTVFEAPQVIFATPLRVTAERIRIDGLSPALCTALRGTPTWMSQHAKVVALYAKPFWRDAGLSGRVASRQGPLVEVHDHTPAAGDIGALFGFVGWDAASRAADPDGLRQAILDQLVRCFGAQAGTPLRLIMHDWACEPLICSATDLAEPPLHPDIGPDILRQGHLDQRLWFAVSESADLSPGLIEGALSAGEKTAQRVIASHG